MATLSERGENSFEIRETTHTRLCKSNRKARLQWKACKNVGDSQEDGSSGLNRDPVVGFHPFPAGRQAGCALMTVTF